MASAGAGTGGSLPPNFFLTPQQQNLLFAALNSNKPQSNGGGLTLSPNSFETSPMQSSNNEGKHNDNQAFNESPFLDSFNEDPGDSSFDFSFLDDQQPRMIGELPQPVKSESSEPDHHEKRSHPDDEEDDSQEHKRRESTEKVPKKPGRKPLTNEPTSKRKAQNRAAQRAFRERKEQHLKDLETKVEELTQASEQANHENSKLRAQVDQMNTELKQYKQRLALMTNPTKPVARKDNSFGSSAVGNLADVNFQFNFPKFGGSLPGPSTNKQQRSASQPISPQNSVISQPTKSRTLDNRSPSNFSDHQFKDDLAKFSGIFTPSMTSSAGSASRASLDSAQYSLGGATSSPSASSNSNAGPSSSCGTSPEPFTQSPLGFKPIETMTTIGEEQSNTSSEPFAQFANIDFNNNTNFDWLANQNGGSFEPQLFGDFREPQDNILSNPSYDDFFNDALNADFFTPFNLPPESSLGKLDNAQTSSAPKPNLIDAIDAQKEDYDDSLKPAKDAMNCNQIWEKLQNCPKAQNGEFDLDGLCSELTKKAKCSGTGPVVGEKDFDSILNKYMGNYDSKCVADSLGIEVDRGVKSNGVGLP